MPLATVTVQPVYALIGVNRFSRGEAVQRLLRTIAAYTDGLGPARFEGPRADVAEVLDEVRTPSLLGSRRVTLVDEADEFIKRHREILERYCAAPCDSGVLILLCDSLPKNTRLFRIIAERGGIVTCEAPEGRAVTSWLASRAKDEYGKRLSREAAERLRDLVGDELGMLDAELSKLTAYVGGRPEISAADVAEMTGNSREEKVFRITDAITARDAATALRCWEQVVQTDPAAPHRAVAGLAYGVRRLLEARRDWEGGANLNELSRRFYTDPGTLRARLERSSLAQLETMQRDLLTADLDIKTGLTTTERAVERFIVRHSIGLECSARAAAGGN